MDQLFPTPSGFDPLDICGRAAPGPGRPRVRLNMITSVDGTAFVFLRYRRR
jgi:hypothetical protein